MSRMYKIEDLLHKEIAGIIITRVDNQDVKNTVTITDIKVSKDIRSAIVYFTTLDKDFKKMGGDKIETSILNSIKDNKKFDVNAVELMYSLPENSFTLINDENENIYLAKIENIQNEIVDTNDSKFNEYVVKQNTNNRSAILKSYDLLLNKKYNVVLNQKTIERVKNFFQ